MKIRSIFTRLLATILFTAGTAAFPEPVVVNTEEIIGHWYGSEQHPESGNIETDFTINADNTFSGAMTINNTPVWQYSGTWSLQGNQVTWVYLESNLILFQEDREEIDVILSVTDDALAYRSLRRGKESILQRVK